MDYSIKQEDREYGYKIQIRYTQTEQNTVDMACTSMLVGDKDKAGYTEEMEPDTGI